MPSPFRGHHDAEAAAAAGLDSPRGRITVVALAVAAGAAWAMLRLPSATWPALGAAVIAVSAALVARRRGALPLALLAAGAVALAAAWTCARRDRVPPDDLAARLPEARALVRLAGRVRAAPVPVDRGTGPLARFDARPPVLRLDLDVTALVDRAGRRQAASGRVRARIRAPGPDPPLQTGDAVLAAGFLLRGTAPRNPGAPDFTARDRFERRAGTLVGAHVVHDAEARARGPAPGWRRRQAAWRKRVTGWLLHGVPADPPARRALLEAMIVGRRDPALGPVFDAFQRVGVAHVLAISGLHVGVLAATAVALARAATDRRAVHGAVLVASVAAYLLVIEARPPAVRAGVMAIALGLGMCSGRRLHVDGVLALSAIAVLAARPEEVARAGFQLSYGVVLGLVHLSPALRRRWFGPPDHLAATVPAMLADRARAALCATVVAWAVAAPLLAVHLGLVSPLTVPVSLLALPCVSLLVALAAVKIVASAAVPPIGVALGGVLGVIADGLLGLVALADRLPGVVVHVPPPSPLWAGAWLAWLVVAVRRSTRRHRRPLALAGLALALWPLAPLARPAGGPPLRVDALDVGDGTCLVVRHHGRAALFDAGSSTRSDVGARTIVPALRALGVRRLDAIAVSHANLDHYGGVLAVTDALRVRRILVTSHLLDAARPRDGPPGVLLAELRARDVPIEIVRASDVRDVAGARWTWLHPGPEAKEHVNDTSMVVRVEAAGRRLLLCGDIQRAAMAELLGAPGDLAADILELPHHGSHHELAVAFVDAVDPAIIVQSTGARRWRHDRWAPHLAGRTRLVTARDGAVRVEVDRAGGLRWSVHRATTGRDGLSSRRRWPPRPPPR